MSDNPFPGPQPYRASDRACFFGREDMGYTLATSILTGRCVTVYGPSGAGKSSLMQAAVIPKLVDAHEVRIVRVDGWPLGENPTRWLSSAMYGDLSFGDPPAAAPPDEAILRAAKRAARRSTRLMLVYVDQLEQLLYPDRSTDETDALFECLQRLLELPVRNVRVVLSLREDYFGRFRDRLRHRRRLLDHGFRVGPLTVTELTEAVCQAAASGVPPQTWSREELLTLMLQVRVPGQAPSEDAEAQAAYAQIVCRALFQQRARGDEPAEGATLAEPILHSYFETTLEELGPLREAAQRLLEDHLITPDGGRTLRTEKELLRIVPAAELSPILRVLEAADILHAEEHQGSRYFELGHDWLAKRVQERRQAREDEEEQRRREEEQQRELAEERAKRRTLLLREIDLIHRQVELVAVSIGGRVERLDDALKTLAFYTKNLFAQVPVDHDTIERWLRDLGFEELESGFFESRARAEKVAAHGGMLPDEMTYFWRSTVRDHAETRRRFYLLYSLRPYLTAVYARRKSIARIYFQDANTPHACCVVPGLSPDILPSDFNWHEYHSFTIVRPANNPERGIRWSPPTVDYAGQGLVSCVSIPLYDGDTLLGVWTMDVQLAELHADLALQQGGNLGRRQTTFVSDYAGKLIAYPAMEPSASGEKGSVHDVTVASLGGGFATLDLPALAREGHGQLELDDDKGETLFVAFRTVPEIQWIIFATLPTADMEEATEAVFEPAVDR